MTVQKIRKYKKGIAAFVPAVVTLLAAFDVVVPADVSNGVLAAVSSVAAVAVVVLRNVDVG